MATGVVVLIDEDGVESLDESECDALLRRAVFGRIGITLGALPVIHPVRFTVHEGDVVFATSDTSKLRSACRNAVIAFEIDGIDPAQCCGWSVLVVGTANEAGDAERDELADLDGVRPWLHDRASNLVRLRPEFVQGRRVSLLPTDVEQPARTWLPRV